MREKFDMLTNRNVIRNIDEPIDNGSYAIDQPYTAT